MPKTHPRPRSLIVRRLETREEVHRLEVTNRNERAIEQIMAGLIAKTDLDRFFVEDSADPISTDPISADPIEDD